MITQIEFRELNDWLSKVDLKKFTGDDQHKAAHWHSKVMNHPFHKPCSCNPQVFLDWLGDVKRWVEANKATFEPQTNLEV